MVKFSISVYRFYGHKKRNGFFIEAGAFNGYDLSNSLYFERKYNWTGILVEPNPLASKAMMQTNRKAYKFPSCFSTKTR